ncbi:MAG: hypothetical protein AAF560_02580 [Acidobacteriota bacterium]
MKIYFTHASKTFFFAFVFSCFAIQSLATRTELDAAPTGSWTVASPQLVIDDLPIADERGRFQTADEQIEIEPEGLRVADEQIEIEPEGFRIADEQIEIEPEGFRIADEQIEIEPEGLRIARA